MFIVRNDWHPRGLTAKAPESHDGRRTPPASFWGPNQFSGAFALKKIQGLCMAPLPPHYFFKRQFLIGMIW